MYHIVLQCNMGRNYQGDTLYWRRLRNGKYTWKKAVVWKVINSRGELELIVNVRQAMQEERRMICQCDKYPLDHGNCTVCMEEEE